MKNSVFIITAFFILLFWNCAGQDKSQFVVREPVVAGTFYPSNPAELKAVLSSFFDAAENKTISENAAAIIVPHAGYIFSGQVAASAYVQIDPNKQFSNIFVIGTSHHTVMNGASIYNKGNYRTPLGIVEVDLDLANKLLEESKYFKFNASAHSREHSIEVQLPFLQYWLKKPFKIVPIIISTQTASTCQKIAEVLKPYFNGDNLFVISSDFSHYPDYADAVNIDKRTADAIKTNSPEFFASTVNENAEKNIPGLATSCCGWSSVLTMLCITSETPGVNIQHVKYMNSGDTSYGDKQRVVGYNSFVISLNDTKTSATDFLLSSFDKKELL